MNTQYSPETSAAFYKELLAAEIKNIKPQPWTNGKLITRGQIIAAKGRATIKFNEACLAYHESKRG